MAQDHDYMLRVLMKTQWSVDKDSTKTAYRVTKWCLETNKRKACERARDVKSQSTE